MKEDILKLIASSKNSYELADRICELWEEEKKVTGETSDGYHTFNELYDHRIALFIALCNEIPLNSWKAFKHFDGSEWEGWFIAGINTTPGKQISYHLPIEKWDLLNSIQFDKAPCEWDGHTSSDVVKRLYSLHPSPEDSRRDAGKGKKLEG